MVGHNQQDGSSIDDELERDKLSLEIESLKRQNGCIERIGKIVPVITTLVAVGGLVFSFWNSQSARKTESDARSRESSQRAANDALGRINRIQTQIRADKEQLLEFATNDKTPSIRVAFLIDDLKGLTEELPTQHGQAEEAKNAVTELLRGVAWDLRFDEARHFNFDAYALRRWNNYRQLWKDRPDEHSYFLVNKYHLRIQNLRDADPACVEKLDYEAGTAILTYRNAGKKCNQELVGALIYSFGEHLRVLREANQSNLLTQQLQEFARLTNNSVFANKFFASL